MSSKFAAQCILGRQAALANLQLASETDDLPTLVRQIRDMCGSDGGVSVGYLFQLAEVAIYGLKAGISDAEAGR